MTQTGIHLIPASAWSPDTELGKLSVDALACEERQNSGRSLPADDRRYERLVNRIWEVAHRIEGGRRFVPSGCYAALARRASRTPDPSEMSLVRRRALAAFFLPEQRAGHAHALDAVAETHEESQLTATLLQFDGGFIMTPIISHEANELVSPGESIRGLLPPADMSGLLRNDDSHDWPEDTLPSLIRAFEIARTDGIPVNIAPFNNHHVAAALHQLAYGGSPPHGYRLRFQDASLCQPFHLPALTPTQPALEPVDYLRVALLSHRHLALDHVIDANWFRNAETSTGEQHSVIEQHCAEVTEHQLRSYDGELLRIEMKQTGMLPAVVGFYRGLLSALQQERGRLEVRVEVGKEVLWWR